MRDLLQTREKLDIKTGAMIDRIEEDGKVKNWIEIGFFIFCGFLLGMLTGISSTIGVGFCIKSCINKNKYKKACRDIGANVDALKFDSINLRENISPE